MRVSRLPHNPGAKTPFALDMEVLSQVMTPLARFGASREIGIAFPLKDPEALQQERMARVLENPQSQALVLAGAAGRILGELESIDYTGNEISYAFPSTRGVDRALQEAQPFYLPDMEVEDRVVQEAVHCVFRLVEGK